MKVILDEDTPAPLKAHLIGHEVTTVPLAGWAGVKNGQLLALIGDSGFDALITCDQNMEHQQNLASCSFSVVVLQVRKKKMDNLLPLLPELLGLLPTVQAGQVYHVAETPSVQDE